MRPMHCYHNTGVSGKNTARKLSFVFSRYKLDFSYAHPCAKTQSHSQILWSKSSAGINQHRFFEVIFIYTT